MKAFSAILSLSLILALSPVCAQEFLVPLQTAPAADNVHSAAKPAASGIRLPFFDDFSNYVGAPDARLWLPSGALVNRDYDRFPPTVGMVTLDALDAQGQLYAKSKIGLFPADTLTSCNIRLDSVWSPSQRALTLGDSVCLSFFYLPGGGDSSMWMRVGSCPGPNDSLILEFWNPSERVWKDVWHTVGIPVDSLKAHTGYRWQHAAVMIRLREYLSPDFAFRFRNYCSFDDVAQMGLLGNTDQWLIDYVSLDVNGSVDNRYSRDIAFVGSAPSFLKHYVAMPARQFRPDDMAEEISMTITNRHSVPAAAYYSYSVYAPDQSLLHFYDGGYVTAPTFFPGENYQEDPVHATPQVAFSFPLRNDPAVYSVVHVVKEGVSSDDYPQNDTLRFKQVFDNYFAYDDGVAENGYGVISTTAATVSLSMMFPLRVEDTLTAVDLYFNRTLNAGNEAVGFYLAVWSDAGNGPGSLLYKDASPRRLQFDGLNRYCRYLLEREVVVSGNIYVGFIQTSADYINLGFDRNHDVSDRLFYSYGGDWHHSVLQGALMLRPAFGASAVIGINSPKRDLLSAKVYPNPVSEYLYIDFDNGSASVPLACFVDIYNTQGKCCLHSPIQPSFDLRLLPSGLYLMRVSDAQGNIVALKKFIKK